MNFGQLGDDSSIDPNAAERSLLEAEIEGLQSQLSSLQSTLASNISARDAALQNYAITWRTQLETTLNSIAAAQSPSSTAAQVFGPIYYMTMDDINGNRVSPYQGGDSWNTQTVKFNLFSPSQTILNDPGLSTDRTVLEETDAPIINFFAPSSASVEDIFAYTPSPNLWVALKDTQYQYGSLDEVLDNGSPLLNDLLSATQALLNTNFTIMDIQSQIASAQSQLSALPPAPASSTPGFPMWAIYTAIAVALFFIFSGKKKS